MDSLLHSFTEYLFSIFCHQNPHLLLHISGESLPICMRCGCIYLGVFITCAIASLFRRLSIPWSVGIVLVSILFVEWLTANIGIRASSEISRILSGIVGGAGGVIILLHYGKIMGGRIIAAAGLILAGATLTISFHTVAILLILCSFFLFWANAARILFQIVSPIKNKGKYHENP